jgi:magnesium-dependent phosphatase-1
VIKLAAFDGDNTLWQPLSGLNLSDRTPTDDVGWPHFRYTPVPSRPGTTARDDGALYALRPEAPEVLERLRALGVLVGVISYNHEGPVRDILRTFGILDLVDYIVAEWHTNKDRMLERMLEQASRDHRILRPDEVLLVDDDPDSIYAGQFARLGAPFRRFGVDITDLREVLPLVGYDAASEVQHP